MSAFLEIVGPCIDKGYVVATRGGGEGMNPWPPGTVAGEAWSLGFKIGSLPRPLRWALRLWAKVWP